VSLAAIIAALVGATAPPAKPLENALWLAVPAADAIRGAAIGYERWFPRYRLSASISGTVRQTASGDYTGIAAGGGAELRYYLRARSRFSRQPQGSMVGWFTGTRIDVGHHWTSSEGRSLGEALVVGGTVHVGYRIQPWRRLEITPSIGHGVRVEHDLSGRLAPWIKHGHTVGLTVGLLF